MPKRKKMKPVVSYSSEQLTEMIRKKARELYEKSGCKPGRDLDNWLEAERIVRSKYPG